MPTSFMTIENVQNVELPACYNYPIRGSVTDPVFLKVAQSSTKKGAKKVKI